MTQNIFKIFSCILLANILAFTVHAGLQFETYVIDKKLTPSETSFTFSFPFENTGESDMEIVEINSSCTCTVTKDAARVYKKGDKGEISGTFSVGDRKGLQETKITLLTDNLSQRKIILNLQLEIPELISVRPQVLHWKHKGDATSKSVKIKFHEGLGIKLKNAESKSENFKVSLIENDENPEHILLEILPISTTETCRGIVRLDFSIPNQADQSVFVHAMVK